MEKENINCIIVRLMQEQILKYDLQYSELCDGICTESQMVEIMTYKYFPDKFIMDSLVQRLGLETEKYESIVSREEYDIIKNVDDIIDALDESRFKDVPALLNELKIKVQDKNIVYSQLVEMLNCLCDILQSGTQENTAKQQVDRLEQVLRMTIPEYKNTDTLLKRHMSKQELIIYTLIAMKQCENELEADDIDVKIDFLKKRLEDTCISETVSILCYYAGVIGEYAYRHKLYSKAEEISAKALKLLQNHHRTHNVRKLLWIWINATENSDRRKAEWIHDTLMELYEEFNVDKESLSWCIPYSANEIYPVDEVVKVRRKAMGMRQLDLAGDICTERTISNIERGKFSPQPVKKMKILRRLGVNYCEYGTIETYDVELHKLQTKWRNAHNEYDYETCKEMMKIFSERLSMDSLVNRQFMASQGYADMIVKTKGEYTDGITDLINALEITCKVWDKNTKWIYSGTEVNIIYSMADLLAIKGNWSKSKELFQKLIAFYEARDLNLRHFIDGHSMVETVFASWYANLDEMEEATRMSKKGVHTELMNGISHLVPMRLYDISWNLENGHGDEEIKKESIRYMRYSYALSLLIQKNFQLHIENSGYNFLE